MTGAIPKTENGEICGGQSEISAERERMKISQVEAENRLGIDNEGRTWRRWEKGERRIPAWLNYIHT